MLLAVSLSAPACLGLIFVGEKYLGSTFDVLCWFRLFWSPYVLLVLGLSRFGARFARAKRLISYALLTEALTLATGIALIFFYAQTNHR